MLKRAVEKEDFGFLVVSTFFKSLFDTIIANIFLLFVDIRNVVHLHIHIHGLASLPLSSPGVRWAVLEPFTLHKIYPERIQREDFENLLRNLTKIDNKRDTFQSA